MDDGATEGGREDVVENLEPVHGWAGAGPSTASSGINAAAGGELDLGPRVSWPLSHLQVSLIKPQASAGRDTTGVVRTFTPLRCARAEACAARLEAEAKGSISR